MSAPDPNVAWVEMMSGAILHCPCGHKTDYTRGPLGSFVGSPTHYCEVCGTSWQTPATADCVPDEDVEPGRSGAFREAVRPDHMSGVRFRLYRTISQGLTEEQVAHVAVLVDRVLSGDPSEAELKNVHIMPRNSVVPRPLAIHSEILGGHLAVIIYGRSDAQGSHVYGFNELDITREELYQAVGKRVIEETGVAVDPTDEGNKEAVAKMIAEGRPGAAEVRPGRPGQCPDDGTCHHDCTDREGCFRVRSCGPLSGVYPNDEWPTDIRRQNHVHGGD